MTIRPLLRYARREVRGGLHALAFFAACLSLGVAAIVALDRLASGIEAAVRSQARELLGADAVVQSWRPLPQMDAALMGEGVQATHVKELVTLVARVGEPAASRSQLVELRVVEPAYPFYGPPRLDPERPLSDLLSPETTVVAAELLDRLGLDVGDSLRIGGESFRIAGRVLTEADALAGSFRLGPRVYLSWAGLDRTPLEAYGSRILRRTLLGLPPSQAEGDAARLVERLRERFKERDDLRIDTYRDVQPAVQRTLRRMEPYLALVALLSLLLGGIGVSQGVRVWIRGRLDAIAILKTLGVRPREILLLYVGQTVVVALAAGALGVGGGLAVAAALPRLLGDVLPAGLAGGSWLGPALHGLAVGVGVTLLFSAGPLLTILRVPPARIFRRDVEPVPWPRSLRLAGFAALAGLTIGLAALESRSLLRGAAFTAVLSVTFLLLAAAARVLARLASILGRRLGPLPARYGALAAARPGADTLGAITALGLGLAVVVALATVERRLALELNGDLPRDAPTAFFVDVQPDQWAGIEAALENAGAARIESVPVIMARLRAIDGRPATEVARERAPDRRWSLTREQRLTYLAELPKGNVVSAGHLWADAAHPEISIEEEYARNLGVRLGSVLRFDVQGVPLDLTVTSLRRVDWRTFGINFFFVVEPGVLDTAPQTRLAAARLPPGDEQSLQDRLAAAFPNVTVIRIREILDRVSRVVSSLAGGVRLLGNFAFVAGVGILAAAFHLAAQRRRHEVALLKTLGFTRRQVTIAFAVEYASVGLTAGLIGTTAGSLLAWLVLRFTLDLDWRFAPGPLAATAATTLLITLLTSLAATSRALRTRPVRVLQRVE